MNETNETTWRDVIQVSIIPILIILLVGILTWHRNQELGDCIPATLQRIFPKVPLTTMDELCHTDHDGTVITNLFAVWSLYSTNKLNVAYSIVKEYDIDTNYSHVQFDYPYLWIGEVLGNDGHYYGHCCLIKCNEDDVLFSHSLFYTDTTNYVTVHMSYENFILHTSLLLTAPELTNQPIRLE